jgi:hypothetical protein
MALDITPKDAIQGLRRLFRADKVPMLVGSPGIGKSDIINNLAKDVNLEVRDLRLSQADPTDLLGFPTHDGFRMNYAPPSLFPLEGIDKIPEGKKGWLIFLDEMNSATPNLQSAAYKIVLDRKVGEYNLHPNTWVVCAGNKMTDKAVVNRLSTAMQSRLIHLNLVTSHTDWLDWANSNGIDHRVISFIKFRPERLHTFDPNHNDNTFACPRTWSFLSDIVKHSKTFDYVDYALMSGTVGQGPATEFKAYCDIYALLPTIEEMLSNPSGVKIPGNNDPDRQYAVTTLISHNMNVDNIAALLQVTKKLPPEMQLLTLKDVYSRTPDLKGHPLIIKWVEDNAHLMIG